MPIEPMRQTLARLMQEAGRIFGDMHHLKFTNVERIHLWQVRAAALSDAGEHGFALPLADAFARKQALQHGVGGSAIDLWQHIDEELGLRAVMRRIAVDLEKTGEAIDQVINGRSKVRTVVAAAPLIEEEAIA